MNTATSSPCSNRRAPRSNRSPGASLAADHPLARQQSEQRRVGDLVTDLPALAQQALATETEPLENAQRGEIAGIGVGLETPQAERPERIVDHRHERFVHVALTPERAREPVADLRAAVLLAEIEQRDVPEQAVFDR